LLNFALPGPYFSQALPSSHMTTSRPPNQNHASLGGIGQPWKDHVPTTPPPKDWPRTT
jgi:hypothetical protein